MMMHYLKVWREEIYENSQARPERPHPRICRLEYTGLTTCFDNQGSDLRKIRDILKHWTEWSCSRLTWRRWRSWWPSPGPPKLLWPHSPQTWNWTIGTVLHFRMIYSFSLIDQLAKNAQSFTHCCGRQGKYSHFTNSFYHTVKQRMEQQS